METKPAHLSDPALTAEDLAWQKYVQAQQELTPTRAPRPCGIKFHGDTGKYSLSYYDPKIKETAFQDIPSPWTGVVIAVRYLVRWKYDEKSRYDIVSREFMSFRHEPITVMKIDRETRDGEFQETRYADYADLKAKLAMPIPMTEEVRYPFDLVASVYVFSPDLTNPQGARVFRYRFAGTTRNAFFDYMRAGVSDCLTTFGASEPQDMPTKAQDGKKKIYYTGTFVRGEIPKTMRMDIIKAHEELSLWLNEGPKRRSMPEIAVQESRAAELPAPPVEDDSNVPEPENDIPFGPSALDEKAAQEISEAAFGKPTPPPVSAAGTVQHYGAAIKAAGTLEDLDALRGEITLDKNVIASKSASLAIEGLLNARLKELAAKATQPAMIPPSQDENSV